MNDPWVIIGWLVLALVALAITFLFIVPVMLCVAKKIEINKRHRKTRDTLPARGQKWIQDGEPLYITNVYETGVIGISTKPENSTGSRMSWGESPAKWRKRVMNRKLYLESK